MTTGGSAEFFGSGFGKSAGTATAQRKEPQRVPHHDSRSHGSPVGPHTRHIGYLTVSHRIVKRNSPATNRVALPQTAWRQRFFSEKSAICQR